MTTALQSHLSILNNAARRSPNAAVFKRPQRDSLSGEVVDFFPISYSTFQDAVEHAAKRWTRTLRAHNIPQRSIVGLWLGGLDYSDAVLIYGLTRAGYIPQLFSLRLPSPEVVNELLVKAKAQALIYDSQYAPPITACPVPALATTDLAADVETDPVPVMPEVTGEDTVFVFHTSGSTSGSPKLIPCSFSWLDSMISKARTCVVPANPSRQDVTVWMGSMCHIGQNFMFLGSLQHCAATIQPSSIDFNSSELVTMVTKGQLNRMNQFATYLCTHIRNSRLNPKLLAVLQSLDDILYSGLELPLEEDNWARENGVKLTNCYGSTECGAMMLSRGIELPSARYLRPIEGVSYGFPVISEDPATESGHVDVNSRLVECVILSSSPDCPDRSLRSADGHYHTGDLFVEAEPNCYLFRGRNDDWIKSENSLRIDTKAIEDNVRTTCSDLVSSCIVVGNGRPSPVLFVESAIDIDQEKLKKEIIRRTRKFHARRYMHERITTANCVVVVSPGTLPRTVTKGNIRRKAVEEQFREKLDLIHGRRGL